jgi:hypothetical protein
VETTRVSPGLGVAEIEQSEIGRQADVAEQSEKSGGGHGQTFRKLAERGAGNGGILLPSEHALHQVPRREARLTRFFDDPNRPAAHHVAQSQRGQIRIGFVHPHSIRRIERKIHGSHQHLAVGRRGNGRFLPLEIGFLGGAGRAGRDQPLMICLHVD